MLYEPRQSQAHLLAGWRGLGPWPGAWLHWFEAGYLIRWEICGVAKSDLKISVYTERNHASLMQAVFLNMRIRKNFGFELLGESLLRK